MRRTSHTLFLIIIGILLAFVVITADLFVQNRQAADASSAIQLPLIRPTFVSTATTSPSPTATVTPSPTFTPTAVPPTSTPAAMVHVVQAGETLYHIADVYQITIEQLARANQRTTTDFLYVGEELLIPQADAPPPIIQPSVYSNTISYEMYLPADAPTAVNGVPYETILTMSVEARQHIVALYQLGQTLGRDPHAFAKVGDSTVENDHFLSRFDEGSYELGDYAYLQRVIDMYAGSYHRDSAAVRIGFHAWTLFDPLWADKNRCGANESALECEIRLHNPAIILIRIGANDVGVPNSYEKSLREIVEYCLEEGVIPIIGTKADRNDGPDNINNALMRLIAADYQLPVWEYDLVANTIPGRGLDEDGIHMNTFYAHDYTDPLAFERGHAVHNLTALIVLDLLTQIVNTPSEGAP